MAGKTQEPTALAGLGQVEARGVVHRHQPGRPHLEAAPVSLVEPKRFLVARSTRCARRSSPSKESTQSTRCSSSARAGEAAVLGDLAHQDDRDAALLGRAHQLGGGLAHLVGRARHAVEARPSARVCTESMAHTDGRCASIAASTDSSRVSASTWTWPQSHVERARRAPRHLDRRLLAGDEHAPGRVARPGAPAPGAPGCSCRCRARRRAARATRAPGRRPARGRARRSPVVMRSGGSSARSASRVTHGHRGRRRRAGAPRGRGLLGHACPTRRRPGSARPSAGPADRRPHTNRPLGRATAPRGPSASGITTRSGRRATSSEAAPPAAAPHRLGLGLAPPG